MACQSTRVSHIADIDILIDKEDYQSARASFICWLVIVSHRDILNEVFFGLLAAGCDSVLDVGREFGIHYNVVVQVVFEVFSTFVTTMTIENAEDLNFRPVLNSTCLLLRLDNIKNNSNSIFINFSYCANVGVCGE